MIDAIGYCLRRRTSVPTKTAASPVRNSAASAYERDTLARNEGSVGGVQWISGRHAACASCIGRAYADGLVGQQRTMPTIRLSRLVAINVDDDLGEIDTGRDAAPRILRRQR
jgi:hypothetical protein